MDVTVLGGGIAGVTVAYLLKHSGFTVALVEAGRSVSGTTGYTTAEAYLAASAHLRPPGRFLREQ